MSFDQPGLIALKAERTSTYFKVPKLLISSPSFATDELGVVAIVEFVPLVVEEVILRTILGDENTDAERSTG